MKIVFGSCLCCVLLLLAYIYYLEYSQSNISKGSPIDLKKRPNAALLLVDLQQDLTTAHGKLVMDLEQTNRIIKGVNQWLENQEQPSVVVYIQQFYPKNICLNLLTNGALMEGTLGGALDERLLQVPHGFYLKKNIRDAFSNQNLDKILEEHQVGHLWIAGIDAAYCVDATIQAAIHRNYKVTALENLIGTKDKASLPKIFKKWQEQGVNLEKSLTKIVIE